MTTLEAESLTEVWDHYRETRDLDHRNQLVLHYSSLVRYVAAKVAVGLPKSVDRDDLVSYGHFGLMEAIESFDKDRGVKFETYAVPRIRGSIIDELRKIDWVPRSVRAKLREYERVRSQLLYELGREPEDAELAMAMGVEVSYLWALANQANFATLSDLDETSDEHASLGDITFDRNSNPEDLFASSTEITDLLAEAINSMPERYQTIIALYYLQEMTLAEIGEVLGVTESRVCQLQSRVLQTLRDTLSQGVLSAA